jgi:hypothetical protein
LTYHHGERPADDARDGCDVAGEIEIQLVVERSEFVPSYEASFWTGVGAPQNTPVEIIEKLNKEINVALADPRISARLTDLGGVPLLVTPAYFGKLIAEDAEKWGKVIKFAGIKPE